MSYSRVDDKEKITGGVLSVTGIERQATSGLDCLSLLELPTRMPLSVRRWTFLLLWEQLVWVELGKAKGQKRFVDDLMVADKSSRTCTTCTSGQCKSGHEHMTSLHGLLLLLAAAPLPSLVITYGIHS